ncbi:beta strand repeat-containing protein [Deinococcus arcticus]|nr:isopeptide-forming domain-containing fimbrial protein [Deinococcus arcticus]
MANASNPNVRLVKTIEGGATTITNGDSLRYILTVDNAQGVTEALNVVTVDTLPQGLTYNSTEISYDGGTTWATLTGVTTSVSGGVTTITTPSVRRIDPDGKVWGGTSAIATQLGTQNVRYRITATANGAVFGNVTNSATATSGVTETTTVADNTGTRDVTINRRTNLAITKTNSVSALNAGGTTTYTVRVTNNGPDTVTGAVLRDAAATGLTKTAVACSATPGQCSTAPTITQLESAGGFALPALNSGQFFEITVTATVNATSGSVTNTATVAAPSGATDPDTTNNSASDTDTVTPVANLAITKTDSVTAVNAGGTTTYTIRVTNNGPSPVTGAVLRDAAATGLTKGAVACSATPGQCTAGTTPTAAQLEGAGGFALPALNSGQFYELSLTATVTATSGSVTNTATVAAPSGTTDPDTTNNSASDTDTVTPVANLAITKTNNVTAVNAGSTTTYTIRVTNGGPSSVTGAILKDAAATGLIKGTVTCSGATGNTCAAAPTAGQLESGSGFALPALANGAFYEITLTATVTATGGSVANTATVDAPTGTVDPTPGNNTATDTDTVTPVADLSITKTDGVTAVNAGGTTTYTIRVTNNGPSPVTGAVLRDAAATGLTKGAVACSGTPGQCTAGTTPTAAQLESAGGFALPALNSGQFFEITVTATVSAAATSVTNTATITAPTGTTDPVGGNNSASDTDTVTPVADLGITKTDGVSAVNTNGSTIYTIRVTNNGPSAVTGATLTDAAPAGLTFTAVACSGTPGQCTAGTTPSVTQLQSGYALPLLNSGAFYEIRVTATVTATSGSVANTATIAVPSGTTDPTPGNNSATDTNTVSATFDLAITKTGPAFAKPGETFAYTIRVSNTTATASGSVTVTDVLPAGLTFVSADNGGSYTAGTRTVTWTLTSVAGNANTDLTLTVTAPADATIRPVGGVKSVQNTASLVAAGDSNAANNTSAAVTTRFVLNDVAKRVRNVTADVRDNGGVARFGTTGGGKPGEVLEYCLDASNLGGADLPGYVLTDQVPGNVNALLTAYDAEEPSAATGFGVKVTRGGVTYRTSAADADTGTLTATGGTFGRGTLTLNLGTLAAGETATACFQTTIR